MPKKSNLQVVTIGGGTGTPVINQALLLAGVLYIHSISTVMDSGGITGRMRTDSEGKEIAYSDALRTFLSLIHPRLEKNTQLRVLRQMLRKRNDRGQDLGYTIFSHYFNEETGFSEIQNALETLVGFKFSGEVVPVTLKSTNLCFSTKSGHIYHGEHELDDKRMSADEVADIWLDPEVPASDKALELLSDADLIIYSCGSLHGSILVNLLPKGVTAALRQSKATKVLITNLASSRNETNNFKPWSFLELFQKYTNLDKPLDIIITPKTSREKFEKSHKTVTEQYALEHSHYLGWTEEEIAITRDLGVKIVAEDTWLIDPVLHRLRHNPKKLAAVFTKYILK